MKPAMDRLRKPHCGRDALLFVRPRSSHGLTLTGGYGNEVDFRAQNRAVIPDPSNLVPGQQVLSVRAPR